MASRMGYVEYNSLGEIILPIHLDALTETRVALSDNPKRFLEAFEHVAGREALILSAVHKYLRALPPAAVEQLIPALRAMGERRAVLVSDTRPDCSYIEP